MRAHEVKRVEKVNPRCHSCEIDMKPEILLTHFPKGELPTRGYKCSQCGYELIPLEEAKRVQQEAESLGLFGSVNHVTRTITKCGNNLAIYVPKEIERTLGLKQGRKVKLWLENDEICIKPT
jgi:hypothetical protein